MNGIVETRETLEQIIGRYYDFLGDEAARLCREHSIPSTKDLQADLASIEDENRLLKIGIVGRVKSGKSSLLNALLFKGQSILPEAATPMTAALTTLSHGEIYSAEVVFFSQEDFEDIEDRHREYKRQWKGLYERFLEEEQEEENQKETSSQRSPEEQAQIRANIEMEEKTELAAVHEQYTNMIDTGMSIRDLKESTLLEFENVLELGSQLKEYVGEGGSYMPFTKSVNIRLPQEALKDIEIVDTPGIDDPVQSREERTREHLNQCDVVLIVSPAGEFMSDEDLKLMHRITSKEGIRELRVVASKADLELHDSLGDENAWQLDRVLKSLNMKLGTVLEEVIKVLKKRNPEVEDTYDSLIEGQSKIIYSSGMCESLIQRFGQKDEWNEGMMHTWDSLLEDYPDYFSDTKEELSSISLGKLSNMAAILEVINEVQTKKQEIIKEKRMNYVEAKSRSLHDLKDGLCKYTNDRQAEIEKTDIKKLEEQRRRGTLAFNNASVDIRTEYEDSIKKITRSLKKEAKEELEKSVRKFDEALEKYTRKNPISITRNRPGVFPWFARILGTGGIEGYEDMEFSVRTTAIARILSRFSGKLIESLTTATENKKEEWRNLLIGEMTKILRENFSDESLDASMIRRVIIGAVDYISIPSFKYEYRKPGFLRPQGELKGDKAVEFIIEAEQHLDILYEELDRKVEEYTKDIAEEMQKVRLEERLLGQLEKELSILEQSIANKVRELSRVSRLKGELERIHVN